MIEYGSCEKLQRDIMEQLRVRERTQASESYSRLSAAIRLRLKQYKNEVRQLEEKVSELCDLGAITFDEGERRKRQIEHLQSKSNQMDKMFSDNTSFAHQERASLLGSSDWGSSRDDRLLDAGNESVNDIQKHKQRMLAEQEEGLDNLSKIIARQKDIAQTIGTEVDLQYNIIDDLGTHITRTDARINNETRHITVVDRKDKSCVYWVIIVLLFLSIITVVSI